MDKLTLYIEKILNFIEPYSEVIIWTSSASVVVFVGTLVAIPFIISRLPSDYFIRDENLTHRLFAGRPVLRFIFAGIKNFLGAVFFIAGFIMLFIPGQGLITMVIGYSMMDFISKRDLVYKIVRKPRVYEFINRVRRKAGKEPIKLKDETDS